MNPLTTPLLLVESLPGHSNLFYGSGFSAHDPVVFLDTPKRKLLVVPLLEVGRAAAACPGIDVLTPDDLPLDPKHKRHLSEWALALLRHASIAAVLVPSYFPVAVADCLRKAGINVKVANGPIYPRREIKTDAEIALLRASQRAAVKAMKEAIRVIADTSIRRDGVLIWKRDVLTSERLRTVVDQTLLSEKCVANETILACGPHAADPHERGSGPLRARESIVLDIFPRHKATGYWGDITRTVVRGRARPELKSFYRAVAAAQKLALSLIRPGITGSDVHTAVKEYFDHQGFPMRVEGSIVRGFFHGTGHGIGLDVHEAPSLSPAGGPLQPGHVVTVEPGLYDPDIGGVRIEDVVVVTSDGCRILATCPKPFELV